MNRRRRRDLSMAAELLCVACVSAAAAFIGGGRTSPVAPPLKLFPFVRAFISSRRLPLFLCTHRTRSRARLKEEREGRRGEEADNTRIEAFTSDSM